MSTAIQGTCKGSEIGSLPDGGRHRNAAARSGSTGSGISVTSDSMPCCANFTGSEFTDCEHILALCDQPGNQSGPGIFSGDERFAGAGVATVRDQTPANKYRH